MADETYTFEQLLTRNELLMTTNGRGENTGATTHQLIDDCIRSFKSWLDDAQVQAYDDTALLAAIEKLEGLPFEVNAVENVANPIEHELGTVQPFINVVDEDGHLVDTANFSVTVVDLHNITITFFVTATFTVKIKA